MLAPTTTTSNAVRVASRPANRPGRFDADEERHLQPLPVAVDVVETELAQPAELGLDVEQAVRGVLVLDRLVDRREERQVQALGRRGDVLEVGEDPAGLEQLEDLAIERALALVLEVVDRERGDDGVEAPELRQRLGEVVLDELDALIAGEALARRLEHQLGEVEAHAEHLAGGRSASRASRRPSPVPRSRTRRASRGTCSSRTPSPSARCGNSSARPR